MHDAVAAQAPNRKLPSPLLARVRANLPPFADACLAVASGLLLVLSFPDFDLWWLAWIGLTPLLIAVGRTRNTGSALCLGWLWGAIFFYGTCWWLTYPMIRYSPIPPWLAYLLLLLPVMFVALFPALFCALVARTLFQFGRVALFVAPFIWVAIELGRYAVTGLAWNAIGYSQAFHPWLVQSARWGGVYAIDFLVLMVNVAIATLYLRRGKLAVALSIGSLVLIPAVIALPLKQPTIEHDFSSPPKLVVVAIQPNVPMDPTTDSAEMRNLLDRHLSMSNSAMGFVDQQSRYQETARLVIWPESPMNFTYSRDSQFRDAVSGFARANHTSLLLNSLEPAPNGGEYNSAMLVNEQGQKAAQYDKIRLMPFGEYVPLPRWLPGASSVRAIVGEFTPGGSYTLMPLGDLRAGVFICVEAAHPTIARTFTNEGADVLINISNDGYLGPTPVMRQHLANAIFRAVENDRSMIRVTNSGISAYIDSSGRVSDITDGFAQTERTWIVRKAKENKTFYTRHGDVFAYACALITLGIISASFVRRRFGSEARPLGRASAATSPP